MLFRVCSCGLKLRTTQSPRPRSPGPRHEDPPGTRGKKRGWSGSEIAILSEEEGSEYLPPSWYRDKWIRGLAPLGGWQTKGVREPCSGFRTPHGAVRNQRQANASRRKAPAELDQPPHQGKHYGKPCVSDALRQRGPPDRWRERTAGNGMWQPTEKLLSWSPSGDSASPYG